MLHTSIIETDGGIAISNEVEAYEIHKDPPTGDWGVEEEGGVMYLITRDGAIEYALEKMGVLNEGDYRMAPDRTSA